RSRGRVCVVVYYFDGVAGLRVAVRIGAHGADLFTLSLHDALPICRAAPGGAAVGRNFVGHTGAVGIGGAGQVERERAVLGDRRRDAAAARVNSGDGKRARARVGVVDDDFDGVAGRRVAGRIGDHGV